MLFSLHHLATLKPLLLHSSTCFDHKVKFCSCLNVLIPFFIRNSPIFFVVDDRIQSSTTFIIHIFACLYLSDKTGRSLTVTEELLEEAKAQVETLKDEIKAEMLSRNTEEMTAGRYICRWTSVLSKRFDSTTFKKEHAEMYKQYTKQTASRRFSIA